MRTSTISFILSSLIFAISLSLSSLATATELKFEDDVQVIPLKSNESTNVSRGKSFSFTGDQPVMVQAKGFIPVILLPISSTQSIGSSIKLHSVKDWPTSTTQQALSDGYDDLVASTVHIQQLLSSRNNEAALSELDRLQLKYPGVTYLNFYRANALFLKANRSAAIETLKLALKYHPTNREGLDLLKILETK